MKIYKMHWAVMFLAISASELWASQLLIKTSSDKIPSEFIMLIEHINTQVKETDRLKTFYTTLQSIDESLRQQNKSTVMFLLKSEIYRGILENQILAPLKDAQIGKNLFENNEKKLSKYKDTYSRFSYYIYQSIHQDLKPFAISGELYRVSHIDPYDAKLKSSHEKINLLLKYEATWAHLFNGKDPIEFNQAISQLALYILENIKTKSKFLKQNAHSEGPEENTGQLFQIPQLIGDIEEEDDDLALGSIKARASENAKKSTEKIDDIDYNDANVKIDQILEKQEENSTPQSTKEEEIDSQWQPMD